MPDGSNLSTQGEAGQSPAPQTRTGLKNAWDTWRSTSVILPDGTTGQIIINSRAERLKVAFLVMKISVFLLAVLFSNSILEYIGARLAGNSGAIVRGARQHWLGW